MPVFLEKPDQIDAINLIQELDTFQDALYPPEARYALDIKSLLSENLVFAVARTKDGYAMGCGAIVFSKEHGELKRMYVRPEYRSRGIAQEILHFLENLCIQRGCVCIYLETGPFQTDALRFYEKQKYLQCAAFGDYPEHPLSVFMKKIIQV